MSQITSGTVTVETANATVIGANTIWSGNVSTGDIFIVVGDTVSYEVGSVTSNTELQLTAPYAGANANGESYVVARDFTPLNNIPYINKGDVETALILKRALMLIDGLLP